MWSIAKWNSAKIEALTIGVIKSNCEDGIVFQHRYTSFLIIKLNPTYGYDATDPVGPQIVLSGNKEGKFEDFYLLMTQFEICVLSFQLDFNLTT